jgi:hypothetical protein
MVRRVEAPAGSTLLFFETLVHGSGIIKSGRERLMMISAYGPSFVQEVMKPAATEALWLANRQVSLRPIVSGLGRLELAPGPGGTRLRRLRFCARQRPSAADLDRLCLNCKLQPRQNLADGAVARRATSVSRANAPEPVSREGAFFFSSVSGRAEQDGFAVENVDPVARGPWLGETRMFVASAAV